MLEASAEDPRLSSESLTILARSRYLRGEPVGAFVAAHRAAEIARGARQVVALSEVLLDLGDARTARTMLEGVEENAGPYAVALEAARARLEALEGHPRKSLRRFEGLVRRSPSMSMEEAFRAGTAAAAVGRFREAVPLLERAARSRTPTSGPQDPSDSEREVLRLDALGMLSDALLTLGRRREADAASLELASAAPDDPRVHRLRLRVLMATRDPAAEAEVDWFLRREGPGPARRARAEALLDAGRTADGEEEFFRLLGEEPGGDPMVWDRELRRAYRALDDLRRDRWGPEERLAHLRAWNRRCPDDPTSYLRLALILDQRGRTDAASRTWVAGLNGSRATAASSRPMPLGPWARGTGRPWRRWPRGCARPSAPSRRASGAGGRVSSPRSRTVLAVAVLLQVPPLGGSVCLAAGGARPGPPSPSPMGLGPTRRPRNLTPSAPPEPQNARRSSRSGIDPHTHSEPTPGP